MEYEPLYTPGTFSESAFIESLLESYKVRYYIHGEVATRIYPQLSLTERTFYVHPDDLQLARKVLNEIIKPQNQLIETHLEPHTYIAIVVIVLVLILAVIYFVVKDQTI